MRSVPVNHDSYGAECTETCEPVRYEEAIEIAWAAGLFEGEGTIYADRKKGRLRIRFTISITDLDVLERFHRAVGVGSISGPYWHKRSTKPYWSWKARKTPDVEKMVRIFAPFLGERRLARLIELQDEFSTQRPCRRPGRPSYYVSDGQMRL